MEYNEVYKQRCPNGDIAIFEINFDHDLPKFFSNPDEEFHKFLKTPCFANVLRDEKIHLINTESINEIKYSSGAFDLISGLAKKLFVGGCYFSTLVDLDKYEGPDIDVDNSFSLTRDLIAKYFSGNLMELRVFEIHGLSWNSWFDLEMMDYLSDTYFIVEPINRKAILILFKDAS